MWGLMWVACQSASLTAALQRTISMSSCAWPDSRVMSTMAVWLALDSRRSHTSDRVSRVLQASRDPSPIVTQPAGRHSASKLTFVYISSDEVDIGELFCCDRHYSPVNRLPRPNAASEELDLELDQDTHERISGDGLVFQAGHSSQCQHARTLRSDLSGWHQLWSQTR
jgi:hypothetical protein